MTRSEALQIMRETSAQLTVGDNWREVVDPSFYIRGGWPKEFVDALVREHTSEPVVSYGVWHKEFLQALCDILEVAPEEYNQKQGIAAQCKGMAICVWLAFYEEEEKRGKAQA
jgi:hypothetical protein